MARIDSARGEGLEASRLKHGLECLTKLPATVVSPRSMTAQREFCERHLEIWQIASAPTGRSPARGQTSGLMPADDEENSSSTARATARRRASAERAENDHRSGSAPLGIMPSLCEFAPYVGLTAAAAQSRRQASRSLLGLIFPTTAQAKADHPSRPPHPEVPFARAKGLEGALQTPKRSLEGSLKAATRHLRMR